MIDVQTIPDELKVHTQWVTWRYEQRDGKQTKIPINVMTGEHASSTNPRTWAKFEDACDRQNGCAGIGFVFDDTGITGIDLDHCRDSETGIIGTWALEIISSINSYTEISPSGTGVHIIVKGKLPTYGNRKGRIEMYDRARFFCMTGNHLDGTPTTIESRQAELDSFHLEVFGKQEIRADSEASPAPEPMLSDEEILDKARAAANAAKFRQLYDGGDWEGYQSQSEADSALCMMLAFYCARNEAAIDRLFRRSALMRDKWNSKRGDSTYGAETIKRACAITTETYRQAVPEEAPPISEDDYARLEREGMQAEAEPDAVPGVVLSDFYAYMPMHAYIFVPGRELWPAASVNARIIIESDKKEAVKASTWLDSNRSVEQMTWSPGEPLLIQGRLISEGGWIDRRGCSCFNLYRPPKVVSGNPARATPWLDHIRFIYSQDADHIVRWLAHRVQRPQEKINHALVLGGLQGIGKDTLLEPVKYAIGPWNFCEISPAHLLGRFNSWIKSVILRINEARDLGDVDRFGFYDHLKAYTAAPPDVLRCDEKNVREYAVLNVCGVVITTNHKTDGIYLPADDRRHYIAWSDRTKDDFSTDYWNTLYSWYAKEGNRHVGAYLRSLDISAFDPKAPPPKTDAFWSIVDANRAPEDAELSDALDLLGNPKVVTLAEIITNTNGDFAGWLRDRKNSRQIPHRMESVGYLPVRNEAAKDGLWKVGNKRQVVYGQRDLSIRERIETAMRLAEINR